MDTADLENRLSPRMSYMTLKYQWKVNNVFTFLAVVSFWHAFSTYEVIHVRGIQRPSVSYSFLSA